MHYLEEKFGIKYEDFVDLVDHLYDEVWIYDDQYTILYTNRAVERFYHKPPEFFAGKNDMQIFYEEEWDPRLLPLVYKNKRQYICRQHTPTASTVQIATPIFDEDNNIKYVIENVRHIIEPGDFYVPYKETLKSSDADGAFSHATFFAGSIMSDVMQLAQKIAAVDSTVLILGESGTGKTLLAEYLHSLSDRKQHNFVSINCASIPDTLLESQLFGYSKGAFTGALTSGKIGLFKKAHLGTIFLDEIGELSLSAQAKLLQVLQNKEILPVGSTVPEKVDVRIMAATNMDLKQMVKSKLFREDLYYRLNVFEILLPPLRERGKDLEDLIYHFLFQYNKKYDKHHDLTPSALDVLCQYSWPGNIRELKHIVERLVVTVDDITIDSNHLPVSLFSLLSENKDKEEKPDFSLGKFDERMAAYEANLIKHAYEQYQTTTAIAAHTGISQSKASRLIRKHILKK